MCNFLKLIKTASISYLLKVILNLFNVSSAKHTVSFSCFAVRCLRVLVLFFTQIKIILYFIKMPKNTNIQKYLREYGDVFSSDGSVLFCQVCEVKVNSEKKFTVTQHIKTNKHEMLAARQKASKSSFKNKQQLLTATSNKKSNFSKDLCKALMCANISINKVSNKDFRKFLESIHFLLYPLKVL